MINEFSHHPLNSVVVILDEAGGDVPDTAGGGPFWFSPSCVAVICYPEQDGPTHFRIGPFVELNVHEAPAFDRFIETPSGNVIVACSDPAILHKSQVGHVRARIRVWISHPGWPEEIAIAID